MKYNHRGFIKLYREILDWEWYDDTNTFKVMIHLLLNANFEKKSWRGIEIEPGQLITSYEKIGVKTGLTISKVRTAIHKLKSTSDIIVYPNNKYTLIELRSFFDDKLQNSNKKNSPITAKSQSSSNQIATTKNDLEIKRIKKEFKEKVYGHSNLSKKILNSFVSYWTELNLETGIMRFQNEKFWELEKRLNKWVENEKSQISETTLDINR
jgi:hypothetical protein